MMMKTIMIIMMAMTAKQTKIKWIIPSTLFTQPVFASASVCSRQGPVEDLQAMFPRRTTGINEEQHDDTISARQIDRLTRQKTHVPNIPVADYSRELPELILSDKGWLAGWPPKRREP